MDHAFICHASEDKPTARKLASDLNRYGVRVWLDERELRVGESLRERIEAALEKSHHVIILISRASLKKEWVKKELSAAIALEIERKKEVIVPVLLDKVSVPLLIRDKLYADLENSYKDGLAKIIESIRGPLIGVHERLENLSCIHTLTFQRLDGSIAYYEKEQRMRCVDGDVGNYQEELTADGKLDGFRVNPGAIVKTTLRTGTTFIDTVLTPPLQKGKTIKRTFSCYYRNSFCATDEYYEMWQFSPTRKLQFNLIFLKGRTPITISTYERRGSDVLTINDSPKITEDASGRPTLVMKVKSPNLLSGYGVSWKW